MIHQLLILKLNKEKGTTILLCGLCPISHGSLKPYHTREPIHHPNLKQKDNI